MRQRKIARDIELIRTLHRGSQAFPSVLELALSGKVKRIQKLVLGLLVLLLYFESLFLFWFSLDGIFYTRPILGQPWYSVVYFAGLLTIGTVWIFRQKVIEKNCNTLFSSLTSYVFKPTMENIAFYRFLAKLRKVKSLKNLDHLKRLRDVKKSELLLVENGFSKIVGAVLSIVVSAVLNLLPKEMAGDFYFWVILVDSVCFILLVWYFFHNLKSGGRSFDRRELNAIERAIALCEAGKPN